MCFVVEDEQGVMGYVVAALDTKSFRQKQKMSWVPAMCEKYPKPQKMDELTPAEVTKHVLISCKKRTKKVKETTARALL